METFGDRLTRLMKAKGLTPSGLADRLKMRHDGAIRHLMSGESKLPSAKNTLLLAEALGVSPYLLFFGREGGATPPEAAPVGVLVEDRLARLEDRSLTALETAQAALEGVSRLELLLRQRGIG